MPSKNESLIQRVVDFGWRAGASGLFIWSTAACGPSPVAPRSTVEPARTAVTQPWLSELPAYYNRELPESLVRKIAHDMISLPDYPSLVSGGRLLIDNYDHHQKLIDMQPAPTTENPFPMRVAFTNKLDGKTRAFFQVEAKADIGYELTLFDKTNKKEMRFVGVKAGPRRYGIFLNTLLVDVNPSTWSYKLLLAKEASHFLYMKQQVDDVWNAVAQKYEVRGTEEDIKTILWNTAFWKNDPKARIPSLAPHFDRAEDLLDYAGYWHINADIQRLSREGKLTQQDRNVLEANIAISDLSLKKGLLIPNNRGRFDWKEGIGPFSDEWIAVVDEALSRL